MIAGLITRAHDALDEGPQLAEIRAVLAERQDEARQLAEIRAVLAAFDWEHDDRQYALEHIDRIAGES